MKGNKYIYYHGLKNIFTSLTCHKLSEVASLYVYTCIIDILTHIMFKTKKQTFELIQNGTIINVSVMNNDEVHKEYKRSTGHQGSLEPLH